MKHINFFNQLTILDIDILIIDALRQYMDFKKKFI